MGLDGVGCWWWDRVGPQRELSACAGSVQRYPIPPHLTPLHPHLIQSNPTHPSQPSPPKPAHLTLAACATTYFSGATQVVTAMPSWPARPDPISAPTPALKRTPHSTIPAPTHPTPYHTQRNATCHTAPQHTTTPQHNTASHTTPHHLTQNNTAWHTTPHHTTPHRTTPHHISPRLTTPHHVTPRHATPHASSDRSLTTNCTLLLRERPSTLIYSSSALAPMCRPVLDSATPVG